jgi:toxin ParE1/3/4
MSFVIEYAKPVDGEVQEILNWYKEKSLSVAINFLSQLNHAERSILKNPFAYRLVSNQGIRRIVLKKFPYKVYFRIDITTIYILAVIHFARSNRYIRKRLKK